MGIRLNGSPEYLNNPAYEALLIEDRWIPNDVIWIMAPTYTFLSFDSSYEELIKVLVSPVNRVYAESLVNHHNEIYNSPLAKALREAD